MKRKRKSAMKRKKMEHSLISQVKEIKEFLKKHQATFQLRQAIRLYC